MITEPTTATSRRREAISKGSRYSENRELAIISVFPNTGGTIITVVSPNALGRGPGTSADWHSIVDVFFGCLEIGVAPDTGFIQAYVDNDQATPYDGTGSPVATSSYAIPDGTNVVLSLVAQPDGSFAVYANTVLVITNASIVAMFGPIIAAPLAMPVT